MYRKLRPPALNTEGILGIIATNGPFISSVESLGNLFIDFMELYRNGAEALVIHRMNALNLNIITEG